MYQYDVAEPWTDGERLDQSLGLDPNQGRVGVLETPILARIPDLDAPPADEEPPLESARPGGRIVSQGFSLRLLSGGALVLILAAVIPYAISQQRKDTDRRLAPNAPEAPPFSAMSSQTPAGPPAPPGAPPAMPNVQVAPPGMSFHVQVPTGPGLPTQPQWPGPGGNLQQTGPQAQGTAMPQPPEGPAAMVARRPDGSLSPALSGPATQFAPDRPGLGQPAVPPGAEPWGGWQQPPAPGQPGGPAYDAAVPQDPLRRYDGRFEPGPPAPAGPGSYRGSPPTPANPPLGDIQTNQPMAIASGTSPPAGNAQRGPLPPDQANSWSYYRHQYPTQPAADYRTEHQADSRAVPGYDHPSSARQTPPGPGVARLEGIIGTPSVRTSHDLARPGVY